MDHKPKSSAADASSSEWDTESGASYKPKAPDSGVQPRDGNGFVGLVHTLIRTKLILY
jgi:hypothetical protein